MERKAKRGLSAMMIVGTVFTVLGAIFLIVGIYLFANTSGDEAKIFLLVFGIMGIIFLIPGIICLVYEITKRNRQKKLLENGNYVTAEFFDVEMNYSINVNSRHPYIARFRYQDAQGNVHIFKSRNLFINPETMMKDNMVKVYVDGENYKYYYVDIDEIMPKVYEH